MHAQPISWYAKSTQGALRTGAPDSRELIFSVVAAARRRRRRPLRRKPHARAAHLEIDPPDVFANQPERQKDQADEEEKHREQRPQRAFLLRSVDEAVREKDRGENRIEEENSESG